MAFGRTSALSNIIFTDCCAPTKTVLNCRVPRNYTAVAGTSTCFVLNLTTVCRDLLQKSLSAMCVVMSLPFRLSSLVMLN